MNQKTIKELFKFLEIQSISAQPERKKDLIKACNFLLSKLNAIGFKSKIMKTGGSPVVFSQKIISYKLPTILIYGHYDVQSPDPLNEWVSQPFKPMIRNNNIYARGVADDKGQLYTWIRAIEELRINNFEFKFNIKFLIEGEEEIGSKNLDNFVKKYKKTLVADIALISDSHCLNENQPIIDYGLRGLSYMEVYVRTLGKDVHSGLYGGNVLNPAIVLAQIISKLKNKRNKVLIPGFYKNVRKLSKNEKLSISKSPIKEVSIINETKAKIVIGEDGYNVAERAGARPTLDVNGIISGYTGEGPKTIIPASAMAKISMRLVPYQKSEEIAKKFEKYVKKICPKGAEISVKMISAGEPILMDTKGKYFQIAENSYKDIFGKKPIYELSGGSIPVTATFKKFLNIDSVLMGYGLPDDGLHSPNEKLSISMFDKGVKTNIELLKNIINE